jgi:hypothetical protein
MLRGIRIALVGLALLTATGEQARAQYYYPYGYGYGGYGFGGWGGTVEGSVLRGLGAYAEGEGVYNYDSAVATSIDVDTAIRLNQYIWNSELEARQRWNAHLARRLNLNKDNVKARLNRIRDNPDDGDIESGEALNAVLHDMTDPRVMHGSSTLRMANATIPAAMIKGIPFRDETDAITLSLDELTDPKSWPLPLMSDNFKAEREAYQKAVDDALAEDKEGGTLKPETVARVRNSVAALYRKVDATIPKTQQPDHLQAMNYLKGLAGLSRMLERPNVESVLGELEKIEKTTVGNLVAFMHSYNLRFAQATTPKQRAVYRELYPIMAMQRDKIAPRPVVVAEPVPPAAPINNPTAAFYGVDPAHLNPKPVPAPPQPTAPKP